MNNVFPSTIIIHSPQTSPLNFIGEIKLENNPDLFLIKDDYSIDNIRALKKFFSQKPYQADHKTAVVLAAENLSSISQNALLKILEEPGENNYLVLATSKPSNLLPTIISRCHIKKLSNEINKEIKTIAPLGKLPQSYPADVSIFLSDQLIAHQQLLQQKPEISIANILKKIIHCQEMLKANINPQSVFDYYHLNS